jgi:hypothetical protein
MLPLPPRGESKSDDAERDEEERGRLEPPIIAGESGTRKEEAEGREEEVEEAEGVEEGVEVDEELINAEKGEAGSREVGVTIPGAFATKR